MPLEVVTTAITVIEGKRRGEDLITAIVYLNHPHTKENISFFTNIHVRPTKDY